MTKTWLAKKGSISDKFEAVPGNSGFFKLDIEKFIPFQKQVIYLPQVGMEQGRDVIVKTANEVGYFDLPKIASGMDQTLIAFDKKKGHFIFQSSVFEEGCFELPVEVLISLARHTTEPISELERVHQDFPLYEVQDTSYVSVGLDIWGFEDLLAVFHKDSQEDFYHAVRDVEGINDISKVASELGKGLVLVDRRKKRIAFVLPAMSEWFADLTYVDALDLYNETKAFVRNNNPL